MHNGKPIFTMKQRELREEIAARAGGDVCATSGPTSARKIYIFSGQHFLVAFGPFVGNDRTVLAATLTTLREAAGVS